jgi:hypothetical protein
VLFVSARLEIQFLPARQGDAIWVRWGRGRQLIIDMGTEETGRMLAKRFAALPKAKRRFELLVITHVDEDHLGGVLTCLSDNDSPVPGLAFDDIWFNGWEHLHGKQVPPPNEVSGLEAMGPAQGERLTGWLRDHDWNKAFDRFPAALADGDPHRVKLPEGLTLTVLGPTPARLHGLIETWQTEVRKALAKGTLEEVSPGLRPQGEPVPPVLESRDDLLKLAKSSRIDGSEANRASITLLLEWRGRRILLTGDALGGDVASALLSSGLPVPVKLDLLKLPHHGSRQNLNRKLVEAVDCPYWAFSTDGTQFRHPDAPAIARLLAFGRHPRPILGFNVPSTFNRWWEKEEWRDLFSYDVEYGDAVDGLTVGFDPA